MQVEHITLFFIIISFYLLDDIGNILEELSCVAPRSKESADQSCIVAVKRTDGQDRDDERPGTSFSRTSYLGGKPLKRAQILSYSDVGPKQQNQTTFWMFTPGWVVTDSFCIESGVLRHKLRLPTIYHSRNFEITLSGG
jgi:hypothetical protein